MTYQWRLEASYDGVKEGIQPEEHSQLQNRLGLIAQRLQ
jgi:hypothetical protein